MFGRGVQHAMKKWIQLDLRFYKSEGSERSKQNEKGQGVSKIENYEENLYKMFQNCEMTDFCTKKNR